jgi:hypothetical protein
MAYVTTIDAINLTHNEYRAVLDRIGVEVNPAAGIYLHIAVPIEDGLRIVEIWDHKEGFEAFLKEHLAPAAMALGINREMRITVVPLHNIFSPRLQELPGLVADAPGRRTGVHKSGRDTKD